MQNKVLVVGVDWAISRMFLENGWKVTNNSLEDGIDLIQFTGGDDVDPSYYGEAKHPATRSNPTRDAREASIYNNNVGKIAMAGICRGAQFLNVMNGGKLWQHVTNHAIGGTHLAYDHTSEKEIEVTSTHHQMMIPSEAAILLLSSTLGGTKQGHDKVELGNTNPDIEALYYPETKSLCYQPHPEYVDINHICQRTYFEYLKTFLKL